MARYQLAESFGVDDGELDGVAPATCFVLGYEYHLFDERLRDHIRNGCGIATTVHAENCERVSRKLEEAGILASAKEVADGWVEIRVPPDGPPEIDALLAAQALLYAFIIPVFVTLLGCLIIAAFKLLAG